MSIQKFAPDLTAESSIQLFQLGEYHITELGNHWRYMQADGAVTADTMWTYIPNTWQIDNLVDLTNDPADSESTPFCVSPIAITDNYYSWVFVGPGVVTLTTAAAVAANAICYGHATAGLIDDAASALLLRGLTAPVAIVSATTGTFYAAVPLYAVDLP